MISFNHINLNLDQLATPEDRAEIIAHYLNPVLRDLSTITETYAENNTVTSLEAIHAITAAVLEAMINVACTAEDADPDKITLKIDTDAIQRAHLNS